MKRRREDDSIRHHYNTLSKSRVNRSHLAVWNNAVKSVLIHSWCKGMRVMDLCGGKGGDLRKFQLAQVTELTVVDIADRSIEEATERWRSMRWALKPTFLVADCCQALKLKTVDVVTCQFALHYAFRTKEMALGFLENVANHLEPGGKFLVTMPEPNGIRPLSNSICTITMREPRLKEPFGQAYEFSLQDCVNALDEYLVPTDALLELAQSVGLVRKVQCKFGEWALAHEKDPLWQKLTQHQPLSHDEREVFELYQVMVFEKTAESK
jgi:mRNA (guanine-N7-)-methyltransferase